MRKKHSKPILNRAQNSTFWALIKDGILYNLPNIEWNILNDGIIEQATLGSHFTHVRRRNEARRDKVMQDFRDICQMLGLEVDGVALIVEFLLTPPVCQDPNDLGVIESLVKSIERLRGDMIKIIKVVDRLRIEVYQHTPHPDLLEDVGGEVSVEFLHHTHRSWMRWLAKCSPSLGRNSLAKEVVRVMETLFLNKISILTDGAEPIDGTFVNEPRDIKIRGWVLISSTSFGRQILPLTRHWCTKEFKTAYGHNGA